MAAHHFQKGKSGNPGGRPKAAVALARMIRERTSADGVECGELVDIVLAVARGEDKTMGTEASRRWALDWLADRGLGKPTEHVEVITTDAAEIPDMSGLSLAELRQLAAGGESAGGDEPPPGNVH